MNATRRMMVVAGRLGSVVGAVLAVLGASQSAAADATAIVGADIIPMTSDVVLDDHTIVVENVRVVSLCPAGGGCLSSYVRVATQGASRASRGADRYAANNARASFAKRVQSTNAGFVVFATGGIGMPQGLTAALPSCRKSCVGVAACLQSGLGGILRRP